MDCIHYVQDRVYWRNLVRTVKNSRHILFWIVIALSEEVGRQWESVLKHTGDMFSNETLTFIFMYCRHKPTASRCDNNLITISCSHGYSTLNLVKHSQHINLKRTHTLKYFVRHIFVLAKIFHTTVLNISNMLVDLQWQMYSKSVGQFRRWALLTSTDEVPQLWAQFWIVYFILFISRIVSIVEGSAFDVVCSYFSCEAPLKQDPKVFTQCLLFLLDIDKIWNMTMKLSKTLQYQIARKSIWLCPELLRESRNRKDGWNDGV